MGPIGGHTSCGGHVAAECAERCVPQLVPFDRSSGMPSRATSSTQPAQFRLPRASCRALNSSMVSSVMPRMSNRSWEVVVAEKSSSGTGTRSAGAGRGECEGNGAPIDGWVLAPSMIPEVSEWHTYTWFN